MSDDDIATYRANYDCAAWERITQGWRLHVAPPGAILAINALCDEVEQLREDAERWRWVIQPQTEGPALFILGDGEPHELLTGERAIAEVDEARGDAP